MFFIPVCAAHVDDYYLFITDENECQWSKASIEPWPCTRLLLLHFHRGNRYSNLTSCMTCCVSEKKRRESMWYIFLILSCRNNSLVWNLFEGKVQFAEMHSVIKLQFILLSMLVFFCMVPLWSKKILNSFKKISFSECRLGFFFPKLIFYFRWFSISQRR